jgi:hypothetical protein
MITCRLAAEESILAPRVLHLYTGFMFHDIRSLLSARQGRQSEVMIKPPKREIVRISPKVCTILHWCLHRLL